MIHDGYLNTFTFFHNNRKIILTPLSPQQSLQSLPFSLSTLLKSEEYQYHSAKEFILLGLDEEENKPHPNTHPLVQSLVNSYSRVFPTEIHPIPYNTKSTSCPDQPFQINPLIVLNHRKVLRFRNRLINY